MYKKKHVDETTIMYMSPKDCLDLIQEQQKEIKRLTNLVEKQGKRCHKYQKMLALAHFGSEENIPSWKKRTGPNRSRVTFAGSKVYGYYAYYENGEIFIGHHSPHEGGLLYHGPYEGEQTPFIQEIRRNNVKMYNSIKKFFANKN